MHGRRIKDLRTKSLLNLEIVQAVENKSEKLQTFIWEKEENVFFGSAHHNL